MARKKPLDISPASDAAPERKKGSGAQQLRLLLFLFAIMATAAVLLLVFFYKPAAPFYGEEKIEIFMDGNMPVFTGEGARVKAFSSCGPFDLYFDQAKVGSGDASAEALIRPAAGKHIIEAKNSRCASILSLMVLEKECGGSDTKECAINGCPGTQECVNGFYAPCSEQRKVCVPGDRIGCSTNGCAFGYETCNSCGTGYGPCLPRGSDSIVPCAGASCN